jgi:hypothetical protein
MNTLIARRTRLARWLAAGTLVLAACGGGIGELILLTVVTPLNGAWREGGNVANEGIQFTTPLVDVQLFSSKFDVEVNLLNPFNFCDVQDDQSGQLAMAGSYDNGKVVLYAKSSPTRATCIEGTITSLIRLQTVATAYRPARSYINSRVDVQMDLGLWVSDGGGTRLKFSAFSSIDNDTLASPIQACDVSPGTVPVALDGLFDGYQVATNTKPAIAALTAPGQAAPRYTGIVYADGATITLRNAGGQPVTLHRQKEATATTCP